ncbi:MAG TPA: cupin domain-containing protein [Burkholderiales bacterium]|nr:cupin domain-containing protein [Burkholderiales bacterium]
MTTKVDYRAPRRDRSFSAPPGQLLGGLRPGEFLERHWQKKPLLIRRAIPAFESLISRGQLLEISGRPDVESRIVLRKHGEWEVLDGPFRRRDFKILPASHWTLLVHGVNLYIPEADRLLRAFSFIPYCRLDDVMVSYAAPQGGVGPHCDSYDVFLLQAAGQRRWQIGNPKNKTLDEGAPLKILKHFEPCQEWLLEPGDMLYLPPGYAHNGIAVDACMTYSIGFRAPSARELGCAFLAYLEDTLQLAGQYRDPDLKATSDPGRIGKGMLDQVAQMLDEIRWSRADVERFLGCYLTEPKAHIFFDAPAAPLNLNEFEQRARSSGLTLDPKAQMLFRSGTVFMNGEARALGKSKALRQLANERALAPTSTIDNNAIQLLYEWYLAGFLHLA